MSPSSTAIDDTLSADQYIGRRARSRLALERYLRAARSFHCRRPQTARCQLAAPQGLTVAALRQKGGKALDEAQLKALLVGKAVWVRNNLTGEQFEVSYDTNGQSNTWHVGRSATVPSEVGNVVQNGYLGVTTPYTIENGKVVTTLSQTPMEVTVYTMGDTYYGARSDEFGYANYGILPKPPVFLHPLSKEQMEGSE